MSAGRADLVHPSGLIPQPVVDKVVARRGRLHVYETLEPLRSALVVIDLDEGPASPRRAQRRGNRQGERCRQVALRGSRVVSWRS